MNDEIKPGDVVELKSGGPRMTVGYIADQYAKCAWFVMSNEGGWSGPYSKSIRMDCLKKRLAV